MQYLGMNPSSRTTLVYRLFFSFSLPLSPCIPSLKRGCCCQLARDLADAPTPNTRTTITRMMIHSHLEDQHGYLQRISVA